MENLPSPVEKIYEKTINECPQGVQVNSKNEVFILSTTTQTINVYNIEDLTQKYKIHTNIYGIFDIWYIEACDGILIQERDVKTSKTYYKICINWRNEEYFTPGKVENVYFPDKAEFPTHWQFSSLEQFKNQTTLLCIGAFDPNLNPTAEIYENSIFIISEKICLVWDYTDRPELRVALILPLPLFRPLFSFYGDYIAIIATGNMFILKIEKGPLPDDLPPYLPGTCCFDLSDNLNVDYGLAETPSHNFLFVSRYLPDSPHHVDIVFRFPPPSLPLFLQFLSKTSVVLLTDKAAVICRVRKSDRENEKFDLCNISSFTSAEYCTCSKDYIIFTGKNMMKILPNPEKSGIDISTFQLPELYSENLDEIQYTKVNNNLLFLVTSSRKTKTSKFIAYSIGKCDAIAQAALSSQTNSIKTAGLCLLSNNSSQFADYCYIIGNSLFEQKSHQKEAIDFYVAAINAKKPITGNKRKEVIEKMLSLSQTKQFRSFVEQAFFLEDDINEQILTIIKQLPRDISIRKLIRSRQFGIDFGEDDLPIEKLYKAVSLSHANKHEDAKELYKQCDIEQIKSLDFEILNLISQDLTPLTLIQIDQPDLPNNDWPYNERMFLYHFLKKDPQKALLFATKIGDTELHISEWPIKIEQTNWLYGDNGDHLAAVCGIEFETIEKPPEMFKDIINGVSFGKKMQFSQALSCLGSKINPIKFLRYFATTPQAWNCVINQIEDPEITEYAAHFLLSYSPSDDFMSAIKNPPDIKGIDEIIKDLEDTDVKLLCTIMPSTGA